MPLQLVTLPLYCTRRRNNHLGLPSSQSSTTPPAAVLSRFFDLSYPCLHTATVHQGLPRKIARCRARDGKYILSEMRSQMENSWGTSPPLREVNFQPYRAVYSTKRRIKINIFFGSSILKHVSVAFRCSNS